MRFIAILFITSLAFSAEEKPTATPTDPRLSIDKQDLINACVAARHALGGLTGQDMVFVAMSIQRLEAIAEKIPKAEAPKAPDFKPKE